MKKFKCLLVSTLLLNTLILPGSVNAQSRHHHDFHRRGRVPHSCPRVVSRRDYKEWKWQLTRYSRRITKTFQRGIRPGWCYIYKIKGYDKTFLAVDRNYIRWATWDEIQSFRRKNWNGDVFHTRDTAFFGYKARVRYRKYPRVYRQRRETIIYENF